ncbi:cytochrome P450 [Paenibacillus sp. XY044]|uniref:cytochrome P450 n=1 Tax=Paenibacillus sp. XY044 TaxID=2026089 RepID=UPI000B993D21|nr:cytochrome P450 [Paenibacillus sp. XY044]OZB98618.1 cytochrome P450 [Paenibacillus sp. XY044]
MEQFRPIPTEEGLDHSLTLLKEGYLYITNRTLGFQSDVFETRLLGQRAICMRGEEAARLFYDEDKFIRHGAAPTRVLKTLFGENGVQTLDGEAHRHRKAMFMSLMSDEAMHRIRELTRKYWELAAKRFETQKEIVIYEEAKPLLCQAACEWAGVPLPPEEVPEKTGWLSALFDSPASIGITYVKGRNARTKVEKWLGSLIEDVRANRFTATEHSALAVISFHRDLNGELLDINTAAVELANIIRPIVAVSIYVAFTALAVIQQPEEREKLAGSNEVKLGHFIQEVRRFYPFFPVLAARTARDFIWNGYRFEEGTLTILDLYGTNHHPDLWDKPERFMPDRFHQWKGTPFSFIPQGGGDHDMGHRCAGEWLTLEMMKESLDFLANRMSYDVPQQDVSYSFNDIPSLPHSKIIIQNVRV